MPRKSLACLGLGLLLVSLVWAQAPADKKAGDKPAEKDKAAAAPALDPALQKLVDQLGDEDYHKRDAATRQLDAMGAKALPALRAAAKHGDPEVRRRAGDLLPALEAATILAPKRVTLALEGKTAAEVLAALRKETGYKIDTLVRAAPKPAAKEARYDFHWDGVTFWEAMDDVCRAAGYTVEPSYGLDAVRLLEGGRYAPHVARAGSFCVTAGGFQETKTVDFSSFPRGGPEVARWDELVFVLGVHAEPRLPLLAVGEPRVLAAYDDEGHTLIPAAGAKKDPPNQQLFGYRPGRPYYSGRNTSLTTQVNLVRPSATATAVKQIKGTLPLTILIEQKAAVVTDRLDAAKGKKFKVGTTSFTVEDLKENPAKQTELKMTITEEGGVDGPNDYTWMNSLWGRIEVRDEKGARMQSQGSSWGGSGANHVQMSLTFAPGGKPTQLVYQVWTTLQHPIAFEFKELPLP